MKFNKLKPGRGLGIKQFARLEDEIMIGNIDVQNIDSQSLINVISNYVGDIEVLQNTPDRKFIAKEIRNAPVVSRVRMYDYAPGTGKATTQFYKYAKAISNGTIDSKKLSTESLLLMIKAHVLDRME